MKRETITQAPSVAEAVDAALEELGVQQLAVEYEVIEDSAASGARVRVWLTEEFLRQAESEEAEASDDAAEEADVERVREEAPDEELTEDELDEIADTATDTIRSILACFSIEPEIEEYEGDEGEIILDIVGEEYGVLIGRHGKTLDALQVLVAAITNRKLGRRHPVVVDVAGYRERRKAKLEEMAKRAADKAARFGHPVQMRPMTSYERRIIHVSLRADGRVKTASEGEEPYRQVVVSPR